MKITIICPVRNCEPKISTLLDDYVAELEAQGHKVHYPPRDTDQADDGCGLIICESHRKAVLSADEVHYLWNPDSKGSHFDFGMAFMRAATRNIKFVAIQPIEQTSYKSYGNVLDRLTK